MKPRPFPARRHGASTVQHGLALVEFALTLPVLVLLVFGAITFTVALYDKSILTNASRQAVRAWVVTKPVMTHSSVQQVASGICQNQLISFGGGTATCVPLATGPDTPVSGDLLTVSVTMSFTGLYIFKDMQISSQTSMRYE